MSRNAWHISGGEGQAANTANRRVLATYDDGTQGVQEINNDLGLKSNDKSGMISRLRAQGVKAKDVGTYHYEDDMSASQSGRGGGDNDFNFTRPGTSSYANANRFGATMPNVRRASPRPSSASATSRLARR